MEKFLDIVFITKNFNNLEFIVKESLFLTSEENYENMLKEAETCWLSALKIAIMLEDGLPPSKQDYQLSK